MKAAGKAKNKAEKVDEAAEVMKTADKAKEGVKDTEYRVQGGEGNKSSRDRVVVDKDGNVVINDKDLNISIDEGEHSQYFLENKRPRGI